MELPKKTLVGLAGQNAWHIWAGDALPRASGKYLPSQVRTQKAGPEPLEATWRCGGGADCWLNPNGSAKKFACGGVWCCCCRCPPPNRKPNRSSADPTRGGNTRAPARAATATSAIRR